MLLCEPQQVWSRVQEQEQQGQDAQQGGGEGGGEGEVGGDGRRRGAALLVSRRSAAGRTTTKLIGVGRNFKTSQMGASPMRLPAVVCARAGVPFV